MFLKSESSASEMTSESGALSIAEARIACLQPIRQGHLLGLIHTALRYHDSSDSSTLETWEMGE